MIVYQKSTNIKSLYQETYIMKLSEATSILKLAGYKVLNETVKDEIENKIYEIAEDFGHGVYEQGNGYLIYNENKAVEDDDEFQDKLEKELGSAIGYDGDGDGNLFVWIEDIVESTQMNEALEGPATSKQLWTLFKLTKQDYRNKNLSKEDAFKMIGELLDKKKNGENTTKPTNVKKATPKAPDADSPVKIGEIYHRMWGYSMCINDYYKVIDVKGKKALVVELPKKAISGDLTQGKVVPVDVENPSRNEAVLALIKPDGTLRIKNSIHKYETFHQWDGEPDWEDHWD